MKQKISPQEYSNILKSIELENISLFEGGIKIHEPDIKGGTITLKFKDRYNYPAQKYENQVIFIASFTLDGMIGESEDDTQKLFSISGSFKIEYSKTDEKVEITKEFFDVFKQLSLVMLAWPYFREYVQNILVRAGLPPLVLPVRMFDNSK